MFRSCPSWTGHLPGKTHHDGLGDVEVGESTRSALVEEQLVKKSVREGVIGCGG